MEIGELILNTLDQYGVIGVIIIICFILLFKFGDTLVEKLAEKISEGKISLNLRSARKTRKDSIFKISRLLTEVMSKLDADRTALFEYHNGGHNLTGLPFLHASITIQRNKLGVDEMSKDFDNVLVSSIPDFINDIDKNVIHFVPDVSELKTTFPRLYRELVEDNMTSAIFCSIEGVHDLIGFLMIAFKQPPEATKVKITKELVRKILKISTLLDYKNIK